MEKRGLGRGLAALIPESVGDERSGRVQDIPVEQIVANPYQPRTLFDPVSLSEMESSIREHGILQPILVREVGHERYQIIAGERRFRAAQNVGLLSVPAIVKECSERDMLEMALVENVQREDISPMEAARAYQRMLDEFGMTQEMIAQRVGKSRSGVANTLRLLNLPEEVQDSVERGEISEGHGRALMMAERPEEILQAWRTVLKRGLSVRETERLARDAVGANSGASASRADGTDEVRRSGLSASSAPPNPNETRIVDELQQALQTKVALRRNAGGSGKIEIEFYSSEELERLLELLLAAGSRS